MCIGHGRLCVCLSLAAFPHYCTDRDVTWGMIGGAIYSSALLGGFAIGARASNAKCQRVLILAVYAWLLLSF